MAPNTAIARIAASGASALALLAPSGAAAAPATAPAVKIPVPASALPHGAGSTATSTPAPNGAQPGTVAPGSSSTLPTTTSPAAGATGATTGATGTTGTTGTANGATGATATAPATTAPGLPTTLGIARRPARKHSSALSGLALVLAAIGAVLVLASLLWALARWFALQPRWTGSLMYSLREASYRASATWAEFSDWARIGH